MLRVEARLRRNDLRQPIDEPPRHDYDVAVSVPKGIGPQGDSMTLGSLVVSKPRGVLGECLNKFCRFVETSYPLMLELRGPSEGICS
jgi:hypothetical protein